MTFIVDDVKVTFVGIDDATEQEAKNYVEYVRERVSAPDAEITQIEVKACDDGKVDVNYRLEGEPFERIRRITGRDALKVA